LMMQMTATASEPSRRWSPSLFSVSPMKSFARNTGRDGALDTIAKKRRDLCRDIVVLRARRLAARRCKAMGEHECCSAVGKDRGHARVVEAARIVDDTGSPSMHRRAISAR
jgi:hypothetical protein